MAQVNMLRSAVGYRDKAGSTMGRSTAIVVVLLVGMLGALLAGCGGGSQAAPASPEVTTPPPPVARISTDPVSHSVNVSPLAPITVTAAEGKLVQVTLTNSAGEVVPGEAAPDGTSWRSTVPLGYSQSYTINSTARGTDNRTVTDAATFRTVSPRTVTYPSMNPVDGQTVGVGQPLAIYFDEPIGNKQVAEESITVTTEPHVDGAFYWFSDKEVHWRPQEFWAPGTKVTTDIKIYGKDLGDGIYGQEDRTVSFTIGDSVIARADGATHQMTVEINGVVVRTMPISMGRPDFPSNNGVHVVTERNAVKVMDSTTYGLSLDAGGYVTKVKWATRISNGGEFVHSAPWSVRQQGRSNVSHGCINLSPENAKWFFDTVKKGDVVITTNTGGPDLRPWDGFGDWQIPWGEWITGGAE
ncbi:MAG: L,D-transpeptidase family protein [Actinobacteria bacterium]|nr:L,D-transpeptidase family protein [Actinomycetota bacterium]